MKRDEPTVVQAVRGWARLAGARWSGRLPYEALYRSTPCPIYLWERQGRGFRLASYNHAAGEALGPGEWTGRHLAELCAELPEIEELVQDSYDFRTPLQTDSAHRCPATGTPVLQRIQAIWVDPCWVALHVEDLPAKGGPDAGLGWLVTALAGDGLSPEAVAEACPLFHSLASLAPGGVFVADADGGYAYVDEAWEQLTGLARTEALGEGWLAAVAPDARAPLQQRWNELTADASPFDAEIPLGGATPTVLCQAVPVRRHDGVAIAFVGTWTPEP